MCVVSMVSDHYIDRWYPNTTGTQPNTIDPARFKDFLNQLNPPPAPPTPEEINEFRRLLERAREYDKRNSQPDCELEAKKQTLRTLAEFWGIDISFIEAE